MWQDGHTDTELKKGDSKAQDGGGLAGNAPSASNADLPVSAIVAEAALRAAALARLKARKASVGSHTSHVSDASSKLAGDQPPEVASTSALDPGSAAATEGAKQEADNEAASKAENATGADDADGQTADDEAGIAFFTKPIVSRSSSGISFFSKTKPKLPVVPTPQPEPVDVAAASGVKEIAAGSVGLSGGATGGGWLTGGATTHGGGASGVSSGVGAAASGGGLTGGATGGGWLTGGATTSADGVSGVPSGGDGAAASGGGLSGGATGAGGWSQVFDAADKVAAEEQDGNGAQPNQAVGELGDGWAVVPGKQAPSVYATAVFGQAGVKPPAPPPAPPTRAQLIEQRLRAFMLETRKRIDALGLGTTATSHAVMSLPAGFSMPAGASVPGSGVLSSDEQGGDGASAKTNGRTSDAGQAPQADGAAGEDGTGNAGASVGGDKASQVVPPAGVAGGDGAGATDSKYLGGNWDDADGYYNVQIGEVLHSRYKVRHVCWAWLCRRSLMWRRACLYVCDVPQVTERVGRGVFSFVVRAIDMNAEPDQRGRKPVVCIKIVRRNDMMTRAAVKEVRILSELAAADPENRRRCIRLLAHFTFRRHSCMVFESMEMDLRKLIRRVGRGRGLSLEAVRSFGQQLFVALKLVHQVGYVHADLKPDNIVVDKRRAKIKVRALPWPAVGRVVSGLTTLWLQLCDFGSAIPTRELPDYHETAYIVSSGRCLRVYLRCSPIMCVRLHRRNRAAKPLLPCPGSGHGADTRPTYGCVERRVCHV